MSQPFYPLFSQVTNHRFLGYFLCAPFPIYLLSKFNISRRRVKSSLGLHKNCVFFAHGTRKRWQRDRQCIFPRKYRGRGSRRNWEIWADGCAECVSVGLFLNTFSGLSHAACKKPARRKRGRTDAFLADVCVSTYVHKCCVYVEREASGEITMASRLCEKSTGRRKI
jgi:hypothetical protein